MLPSRRLLGALLLACAAPLLPAGARLGAQVSPAPATRPELLRGRVTADSGRALPDADVTATMAPDRQVFRARSDADGRWEIRVPAGTGDYLVHIAAPGRAAFRKRVTRQAPTDSVLTVDAQLPAAGVQQLAAVKVQAQRERPSRSEGRFAPAPGASERMAEDGVSGQLSPSERGDLAALAATMPGVVGGTVLGAGADQNQTTLNGLAFAGGEIPRDARTTTRFATSAYDPARGGFSGAQTTVELTPGSIFGNRRARLSLDAPALQATDATGAGLGQRFTRLDASVAGDGELTPDNLYYNASAQVRRNVSDAPSLADASPDALAAAGVAADSVARFLDLLGAAGVPASAAGVPDERLMTSAVFLGRLDRRPWDRNAKGSVGVTGYARFAKTEALGFAPTMVPAHGGEQTATTLTAQGIWWRYLGAGGLTEARTAVTLQRDRSTPYARLPEGRVLVSSAEGAAGTPLVFGANAGLDADDRRWTWETTSESQYVPRTRQRHRLKLYAQSRLDGVTQERPGNRYGSYTFNSLADLEANRPASFARTVGAPTREGGEWSGALGLGDQWRAQPKLVLLYGVRAEANAFTDRPAHNPAVASAFGARTDHAPNTMHVSPRAGFTWTYAGDPNRNGWWISPIATRYTGPRGVLRGGIGEFRGLLPPSLLADASARTGLPGGARRLLCVGDAVPAPEWDAWLAGGAVPETCADGAPALADTAPGVLLYEKGYAPPRSWRANLGWTSRLGKLDYTLEAIGSLNVDQPGSRDLNFAGTPRFSLAEEGGRPVFVSPSAIVPATGASSTLEARRSAAFGPVTALHSDNRSRGGQLALTVTPDFGSGRAFVRGTYVLSSVRALESGFDGAAFGDPRRREWARGDADARHQLQLQGGVYWRALSLTTFTRLTSGVPFTPRVAGDVNGDGNAFDDRAFVFDPATTGDAALRDGLAALLAGGPEPVRACLAAQRGRVAARNSCEGPWTATMNAQLTINGRWLGIGRRSQVSLYFTNPLGGIDQLVHGERDLRGWGTPAAPDPVLLRVRGFDAGTQRFQYEVNRRFGATRPRQTTQRAPFRVTLDVSLPFGPPLEVQQLDRWLKPGRGGRPGVRLNADSLVARYRRNVPDMYQRVLSESDSLLLTPQQQEALEVAQKAYHERMDAHWRVLAEYLAALGDRYDGAEALKRQETATDDAWELARQEAKTELPKILTPIQLGMLPWPGDMLYKAKEPIKGVRVFMN